MFDFEFAHNSGERLVGVCKRVSLRLGTLASAAVLAAGIFTGGANAATYNFECFNGGCGVDLSSQLTVSISDVGGSQVQFLFNNAVGIGSSVTRIAIGDPLPGTLGTFSSLSNNGDANFSPNTSPSSSGTEQIPGWSFNNVLELLASSDTPAPINGLNAAGRSVAATFDYLAGTGITDIIAAVDAGNLVFGLQVQSIEGASALGQSDSAQYQVVSAPIPLPAGGLLLITALGGLGLAARRRRKAA